VRVIGGEHWKAELPRQLEHAGGDGLLVREAVVLHLEPEAVRAEHAGEYWALAFAAS